MATLLTLTLLAGCEEAVKGRRRFGGRRKLSLQTVVEQCIMGAPVKARLIKRVTCQRHCHTHIKSKYEQRSLAPFYSAASTLTRQQILLQTSYFLRAQNPASCRHIVNEYGHGEKEQSRCFQIRFIYLLPTAANIWFVEILEYSSSRSLVNKAWFFYFSHSCQCDKSIGGRVEGIPQVF